jgi:hypothetical protein
MATGSTRCLALRAAKAILLRGIVRTAGYCMTWRFIRDESSQSIEEMSRRFAAASCHYLHTPGFARGYWKPALQASG